MTAFAGAERHRAASNLEPFPWEGNGNSVTLGLNQGSAR
jgi:hypothetical protein